MGIYNVVRRNEDRRILVNCNHRHTELPQAIHCADSYLIAGLVTQIEIADRDQDGHGVPVDLDIVDAIREAMYGGTLYARYGRGIGLVQEGQQADPAPDR